MENRSLTLACLQLNTGADLAENLRQIAHLFHEAVEKGAKFIFLPENAFVMDVPGANRERFLQSAHPGVMALKSWSKEYGVWVLIGSAAVMADDHAELRQYNRSLLMDPDGNIVANYDKIHLFDVSVGDGQEYRESARYLAGSGSILADTPFGKLGMTICYDVRFPHLFRSLAKRGAQMLAIPAAFTEVTGKAHWHVLLRARAIENGCFVIAPAQCGVHPGNRRTYGHSLIIGPWGEVIAEASADKPEALVATIDLAEVEKVRARLPSLMHDREFS